MTQDALGRGLRRLQAQWQKQSSGYAIALAGTGLATAFAILSITHCRFLMTDIGSIHQASVGLFSKPFYNENGERLGCVAYSSMELDRSATDGFGGAMFVTARAFGVMTAVLSGMSTLLLAAVVVWNPPTWNATFWSCARSALAGAAVCSMVIFMVLGDSEQCGIGGCKLVGVGVLAVFSTLLLSSLSVAFIFLPIPTAPWLEFINRHAGSPTKMSGILHCPVAVAIQDCADGEGDASSIISSTSSRHSNSRLFDRTQTIVVASSIQEIPSFRLVTVALILVACAVSVVGVNRCTFLLIGTWQGDENENSASVFPGKGLFSQAIHDVNGDFLGCVAYSSQTVAEFDAAYKSGRAFGALTTLMLTTVLVLATAQLFCHTAMRLRIWYSFRIFLPIITVSQLVTFSVFGSRICRGYAECHAGGTGIAVIINVFLLATLSVLVNLVAPPMFPLFQRPDPKANSSPVEQPTHERQGHPLPEILTDSRVEELEGPFGLTDDDTDNDELYYNWDVSPQSINRRVTKDATADDVDSIDVKVCYTETEKKTIKTIHHSDGSKTITTVIEELESLCSFEDDESN